MNIIPVTIPDDTPIIIAGINEANPCLVSIGKHTSAVGHASSVAGFDFNSNYVAQFLILITTYVILDFLSLVGYAVLANKMITWVKAKAKVINTISACVLIIIALIIAFMQQY